MINRIVLIAVAVVLLSSNMVHGLDNLVLYGTVESVNTETGEITINVKTDSCPGKRVFKYNVEKGLNMNILVGKKVRFILDSANCDEKTKNTIKFAPRKGVEKWQRSE